jgi:hypothetical protein
MTVNLAEIVMMVFFVRASDTYIYFMIFLLLKGKPRLGEKKNEPVKTLIVLP